MAPNTQYSLYSKYGVQLPLPPDGEVTLQIAPGFLSHHGPHSTAHYVPAVIVFMATPLSEGTLEVTHQQTLRLQDGGIQFNVTVRNRSSHLMEYTLESMSLIP